MDVVASKSGWRVHAHHNARAHLNHPAQKKQQGAARAAKRDGGNN